LSGWRQWGPGHLPVLLQSTAGLQKVSLYLHNAAAVEIETDGQRARFAVLRCDDEATTGWQLDGPQGRVDLISVSDKQTIWVSNGQANWSFTLADSAKQDSEAVSDGVICAPMSATVSRIMIKAGAQVAAGSRLMILEAMKMEQPVLAPVSGRVEQTAVQAGEPVSAGQVLCRIVPDETEDKP
ncbi:MAG: biotin/lipoyl-containing protein, partial [Pseudomonadota bacterium]|nr:biotin/lipoyl-containing protein [Pseudomonadota bacterium]